MIESEIKSKFFYIKEDPITGKTWENPKYSRYKMVIRMRGVHGNPRLDYYSLDIESIHIKDVIFYRKNEEAAINGLIQRVKNKKALWQWYSASIFLNITANIDTRQVFKGGQLGGWDIELFRFSPLGQTQCFYNLKFSDIDSQQQGLYNRGIQNRYLDRRHILNQIIIKKQLTQLQISFYNNNLNKPS